MSEPATPSIPAACFDASTPVNGHRISAQRQPVSNLRSQDRDQRSEIRCVEDESSSVSGLQSPISALRQTSLTARVSRRRLYPNRPPRQLKAVGLHAWARAPGLGDPAPDRTNLAEPATPSLPAACFDACEQPPKLRPMPTGLQSPLSGQRSEIRDQRSGVWKTRVLRSLVSNLQSPLSGRPA